MDRISELYYPHYRLANNIKEIALNEPSKYSTLQAHHSTKAKAPTTIAMPKPDAIPREAPAVTMGLGVAAPEDEPIFSTPPVGPTRTKLYVLVAAVPLPYAGKPPEGAGWLPPLPGPLMVVG